MYRSGNLIDSILKEISKQDRFATSPFNSHHVPSLCRLGGGKKICYVIWLLITYGPARCRARKNIPSEKLPLKAFLIR